MNNTVKAILSKQKQLIIWLEQYDQSNIISGKVRTIKAIQSAIKSEQLKQYGQRYYQDKPGGRYIANNTYAKTRDLSKKPDIQEVDIRR